MRITPLQPHLAARVEDVDLAAPMDEQVFGRIDDAFQEYSSPTPRGPRASTRTGGAGSIWSCGTTAPCFIAAAPGTSARHPRVMRRTTAAGDGPTADPPFAVRTPAWDGIIPEGVGAAS